MTKIHPTPNPTTTPEPPLPTPSLALPAPAVWATLSPTQQTRLFQQLVRVCCRLLNPPPAPARSDHDPT
jgi:hypothetical protein